jgi:hypothetical protein
MHTSRRVIAGAGALMVSALITLISMTGTQWVKDHPKGTWGVGVALAVGSVGCFIFWIATREGHPSGLSGSIGAVAGRNVNGPQIGGSVYGDSALEKILKAAAPQESVPRRLYIQSAEYASIDDPTKFASVTECLRLLIVNDRLEFEVQNHNFVASGRNYVPRDFHTGHQKRLSVVYSFNDGELQVAAELEGATLRLPQPRPTPRRLSPQLSLEFSGGNIEVSDWMIGFNDSQGEPCHSIRVHNKQAAAGEEALRADSLSARLTFTFAGSPRTTHVDRACWIGQLENEIYLQPGDTEHVLIIYDNPNKYASGGWPSHGQSLKEVKFSLFGNAEIVGEISVISHKNNVSTTLITRRFVIAVSEANVFCNIRWQDEI